MPRLGDPEIREAIHEPGVAREGHGAVVRRAGRKLGGRGREVVATIPQTHETNDLGLIVNPGRTATQQLGGQRKVLAHTLTSSANAGRVTI